MTRKLRISTGVALALLLSILSISLWYHQRHATPALPSPPLRQLAASHHLELGVYVALKRMDETQYADIVRQQFGMVVIDGEPNWTFNDGALRPSAQTFDFSRIDKVLAFAQANHQPVRIQHLVWGEEKWLPDWLKKGNYSKQQLLDLIHQHIMTMGQHYQGKVSEWTVVNEAFTRGEHVKDLRDWWGDNIGPEYIEQSFIWARQADPSAKLILNDFDDESANPVSDAMYNTVKDMKAKNVPIDGIGMQMHIDGTHPPSKDDVVKNMKRFGELGVKVYVTEFDVNMNDVSGTDAEKQLKEAQIYHDMMRACLESPYCTSFSVLGLTDKESWYNELGVPDAMPLLFDKNYQPKPAFAALRQALLE